MKIERITVNKTPQTPNGVNIELVQPESDLEAQVLTFLLPAKLREAKKAGRLQFVLPDKFHLEHKKDGTFVISGILGQSQYYQPPRPLAIVGLHKVGAGFDIVHAAIDLDKVRKQQEQAANQAKKKEGQTGTPQQDAPTEEASTDKPSK